MGITRLRACSISIPHRKVRLTAPHTSHRQFNQTIPVFPPPALLTVIQKQNHVVKTVQSPARMFRQHFVPVQSPARMFRQRFVPVQSPARMFRQHFVPVQSPAWKSRQHVVPVQSPARKSRQHVVPVQSPARMFRQHFVPVQSPARMFRQHFVPQIWLAWKSGRPIEPIVILNLKLK